ncbi:hypothetical protein PYCC9005_004470 [Savitreella phatthalungensis]
MVEESAVSGARGDARGRAHKDLLVRNLDLELGSRIERLRAQYAGLCGSLATRGEMRVSRVPRPLRRLTIRELAGRYAARPAGATTQASGGVGGRTPLFPLRQGIAGRLSPIKAGKTSPIKGLRSDGSRPFDALISGGGTDALGAAGGLKRKGMTTGSPIRGVATGAAASASAPRQADRSPVRKRVAR